MAGRLFEFAGWLATQVFDVVGSVAGVQGADGGSTVDLQVGKTVFHDVPAKMRTELWLSQLHRKDPDGAAPAAGEYYDLLFEKLSGDVLAEIDKDTHRTFPGHTWLSSPAGQGAMLNVLRAYALSDPEIEYTQGMNFLAGLLLTYLPSEADAYAALSLLMRQRGLREMYLPDMSLLQIRLWQLSKLLPPRLAAHLEAHAALPVLYAASWLLTCFAADFPLHFAARVMDVLMTGQAAASPLLKVAVGIVSRCEAALLRMRDFEEMVNYLRQEVPQWPKAALHDMLTDALSKPWSARQLRVLDQINGAETVVEAVARVNRLISQSTTDPAELQAAAADASSNSATQSPRLMGAQQQQQQQSPTAGAAKGAGGADPQQQQQQQPLTPRTVARTLSRGFKLPKPPAGPPGRAVAWASWKSDPDLQSLPPQRVRIDRSIADLDLVQLNPQLSQALSAYSPLDASRPASFTSAAQRSPGTRSPPSLPQQPETEQQQALAEQQVQAQAQQPADSLPRQQQQQHEGRARPDAAHARWDALARQSSLHLTASPSPFDAALRGSDASPVSAAYPDCKQHHQDQQQQQQQPQHASKLPPALPPEHASAAAAPQAAALGHGAGPFDSSGAAQHALGLAAEQPGALVASDGSSSRSAPSFGSYQIAPLNSTLPLVDLREQQETQQPEMDSSSSGGRAAAPSGSAHAIAVNSFLGLFGHSPDGPKQGSPGASSTVPSGSGTAHLIHEVPTSQGNSLAAVLHALSLNASWANSGAGGGIAGEGNDAATLSPSSTNAAPPGPTHAATAGRQLRHSSELEEWSSFKIAVCSEQGSEGQPGMGPGLSSMASWQSMARDGRQLSELSSEGSGSLAPLPSPMQQGNQTGASRPATPERQLLESDLGPAAAEPQRSKRLSGEAVTQRAASLQEEHLKGFLVSAGKDAAKR